MKPVIILPLNPCTAPRQTRADCRPPFRKCISQYHEYRDSVSSLWPHGLELPTSAAILFTIPIARSKSAKKRAALNGTAHLQAPDIDNLLKAFLDSLYRNQSDAHVWNVLAVKVWGLTGSIAVFSHEPDIGSMIAQSKTLPSHSFRDIL